MDKSNVSNWLSALCVVLVFVLLVVQSKQSTELDLLRQQQASIAPAADQRHQEITAEVTKVAAQQATSAAAADQRHQETTTGSTKLAEYVANLGTRMESRLSQFEAGTKDKSVEIANLVQQQTAVLHRALGKVIPVELPESVTKKLGALEARVGNEKTWPKDASAADAMLAELRELLRQIPPWAEEDLLPRLNALRWGVQSLQLLQANANVDGEALATAADIFTNQISTQPDSGATNITVVLASRQIDATQRFTAYRRDTAIKDAIEQLGLAVTTDGMAVWQRLNEWTNSPTHGPQVLELRQQLRSRLLVEEVTKYAETTTANLQRIGIAANDALRQAGYFRTLENLTVQRLKLLEETEVPASAIKLLANLSASVEARIKANSEKQRQDDAGRVRGYQQWVLRRVEDFRRDLANAQNQKRSRLGEAIRGPEIYTDFRMIRDAMVKHLLPVSPAHLDSAVAKIYGQAFEDGWNKLGGKDEKYLQTKVAEEDATTAKRTPQNYQEE